MATPRIVITGSNGQLGRALQAHYTEAQALSSTELDITDRTAVEAYDWGSVDVIINAAAYTNVDGAETPDGRKSAWRVNALGARNLAAVAIAHDVTLVHISTDYVFDGVAATHAEQSDLGPLGVYGQSKAAGDIAVSLAPKHYLLRTSWVVGDGKNFVRTMLSLGERGIAPKVVADQIGRLTFTTELVRIIDHLLSMHASYGTYNASNSGDTVSWADVAQEVFELAGYKLRVTGTTTAEYFADKLDAAKRPLNSNFDLSKLLQTGFISHDWREDLTHYVEQEQTQAT